MLSTRWIGMGLGASLALSSAACASPRVISGITSSRDQIKFLYQEGSSQGVLKCKVAPDAALTDCHQMAVIIQD